MYILSVDIDDASTVAIAVLFDSARAIALPFGGAHAAAELLVVLALDLYFCCSGTMPIGSSGSRVSVFGGTTLWQTDLADTSADVTAIEEHQKQASTVASKKVTSANRKNVHADTVIELMLLLNLVLDLSLRHHLVGNIFLYSEEDVRPGLF